VRLEGPAAHQAGQLLHHLLSQSLSGLDFCFLWQELTSGHPELGEVDVLVRRFLEGAELSALDRAMALLPEPEEGQTLSPIPAPAGWQAVWTVRSQRMRDTTRLELRCPDCGWEIAYSLEHAANTEMRLPFEEIECPQCGRTG
jgi:predicted RNA-binding Zn-ribbon protein involved in translation (DUF1610 family)